MTGIVECPIYNQTFLSDEKCWQAYYDYKGKTFKIKYIIHIYKEAPWIKDELLSTEEVIESSN